jgi:hypothetical protein
MNSRNAVTLSVTAVHAKGTRVLCSPSPWNQYRVYIRCSVFE